MEAEDWALCILGDVGQLSLRAWISNEGDDVCAFLGGQKDGSDFPETHWGFPGIAERKHPCYRFFSLFLMVMRRPFCVTIPLLPHMVVEFPIIL